MFARRRKAPEAILSAGLGVAILRIRLGVNSGTQPLGGLGTKVGNGPLNLAQKSMPAVFLWWATLILRLLVL